MKNRAILGLAVVACAGVTAWADTAAGLAAFKKGEYLTAAKEWRITAEKGDAEAEYDLGLLYSKGLGVKRDLQVAQQWYEAAAAKGNAQAEFSLAQLYAKGWGVPRDEASALQWIEAANGTDTQTDFTWTRLEGYGEAPDYTKAAYWYRLAADQGHAEAQFDLSSLYSDGQGVPKDYTEAFQLVRKSAVQGFVPSQARLASRYSQGRGVEKNESEAFFWWTVAARHGDKASEKARIALAAKLPPADVAKAEEKALAWKAVVQPLPVKK